MTKLYKSFSTFMFTLMNNFSLRCQLAFYSDFETRQRDAVDYSSRLNLWSDCETSVLQYHSDLYRRAPRCLTWKWLFTPRAAPNHMELLLLRLYY